MNERFKAANKYCFESNRQQQFMNFTCYKKFNGLGEVQINTWRFKAQIS